MIIYFSFSFCHHRHHGVFYERIWVVVDICASSGFIWVWMVLFAIVNVKWNVNAFNGFPNSENEYRKLDAFKFGASHRFIVIIMSNNDDDDEAMFLLFYFFFYIWKAMNCECTWDSFFSSNFRLFFCSSLQFQWWIFRLIGNASADRRNWRHWNIETCICALISVLKLSP